MKNVFITGTTTGIGLLTARELHRQGWCVFAGVLPAEDTSELTAGITERLHIIPIDVTDSAMIQNATATIQAHVGDVGLHGLINNAGIGISAPMEYIPMETLRLQLEVNFFGHVAVTQSMLPMIRQTTGRIVNIASFLGKVVTPFSGAYSASKFALEAVSDALRIELQDWGIHVIVIEPMVVKTPIWKKQNDWHTRILNSLPPVGQEQYGAKMRNAAVRLQAEAEKGTEPEVIVKAILNALTVTHPKTRYMVGKESLMMRFASRYLPDRVRDWLFLRRMGLT